MSTIVGLSGSLRRGSYNSLLLAAAGELLGTTLEIASIRGIPLYDGDVETESGLPESVRDLKDRIAVADGLLIATPEYNSSIPGVAKNAIDWLSRPARDIPRVFAALPVALMGATPGRGGTVLSQAAWLPVLRTLGTRPWFGGSMQVAGAAALFEEHRLHDEETRARLAKFVNGFAEFVAGNTRKPAGG
jgi:chromate reductase